MEAPAAGAASARVAAASQRTGSREGSSRGAVDWRAIAGADTSVVLMGAERIEDVVKSLIAAGKPAPTPAAVVSSATLPNQRTVCAPLSLLPEAARAAGGGAPAIIVAGDVAGAG